jgi:hypothetical protein
MIRTLIAGSLLLGTASLPAAEPARVAAQANDRAAVQGQAGSLFQARRWQKFETAALEHAKADGLSADGVPLSYQFWSGLNLWMQSGDGGNIEPRQASASDYRKSMPDSAVAIMVDVMRLRRDAWAFRGGGYASTVSPQQWELFRLVIAESWKLLQESQVRTAHLPYWYLEALTVGMDADIPEDQLREILQEGLRRFPGNFSLYFGYLRRYSIRWGGDYASMDRFIKEAAAAAPPGQQDVFYARLYWSMHQHENKSPDFFAESLVDWPRMRRGLEQVMKRFPDSAWNRANLVVFACINKDANTYVNWRSNVDEASFIEAAPPGFTIRDCDRLLLRRA